MKEKDRRKKKIGKYSKNQKKKFKCLTDKRTQLNCV